MEELVDRGGFRWRVNFVIVVVSLGVCSGLLLWSVDFGWLVAFFGFAPLVVICLLIRASNAGAGPSLSPW